MTMKAMLPTTGLCLLRRDAKFERRFAYIEKSLAEQGRALEETPLEDMEALWQEAKTRV